MSNSVKPDKIDANNPEWTDEMFAKAKRGTAASRVGRPKSDNPKQITTIRLSPEVLAYFKDGGKGWQTRIDKALQEWVKSHSG